MRGDKDYMDIIILSSHVRDLVLDSDVVVVPGLGTFLAEVVPASFSDKGYTVNPPYRKLTFVAEIPDQVGDDGKKVGDDTKKVGKESKTKVVEAEGLEEFVEHLKKELKETRCVEFPGLGKLRLTKGDQYFFVVDEDANIFPEGFGLEPVSLKNKEGDSSTTLGMTNKKSGMTGKRSGMKGKESGMAGKRSGKDSGKAGEKRERKPLPKWAVVALVAVGVIVLAVVGLRLLGTYAPDFIDKLLYSEEELARLHNAL